MNVEQFANELKLSTELLLEQLKSAGVHKTNGDDAITEGDKTQLLDHLRKMHGAAEKPAKTKITLTRKQTTEIKKSDGMGKARTIPVETRKKRTYVKREAGAAPEEIDASCCARPGSRALRPGTGSGISACSARVDAATGFRAGSAACNSARRIGHGQQSAPGGGREGPQNHADFQAGSDQRS